MNYPPLRIFEEFECKHQYTPISKFVKLLHHHIEQNKTFSMILHLLHFFVVEVMMKKYHIFSYYFLCFSAALIKNLSN